MTDRAALAAHCQAWARWVETAEHLAKGPPLIKTPSGYVQQSPWLTIANEQLELMSRFMAELGLSPSVRARLRLPETNGAGQQPVIIFRTIYEDKDGVARLQYGRRWTTTRTRREASGPCRMRINCDLVVWQVRRSDLKH